MIDSEAKDVTSKADDPPADEQLMEAISRGDRASLQLLIDRYWDKLLRYAESMAGSADEGEDVAQEVFVRVWQHRSRWLSGSSVSGYLHRIAHNLVLDRSRLRRIRDRKEFEVRSLSSYAARSPLEDVEYGELREAFGAALRELPERRREAFLLIRLEGLTLAEAAGVMGVARQTVANHVHMAVMDLREALTRFLP